MRLLGNFPATFAFIAGSDVIRSFILIKNLGVDRDAKIGVIAQMRNSIRSSSAIKIIKDLEPVCMGEKKKGDTTSFWLFPSFFFNVRAITA